MSIDITIEEMELRNFTEVKAIKKRKKNVILSL